MQHDVADEKVTVRAEDAHVEQLIETCDLATVLAYAAMRLPAPYSQGEADIAKCETLAVAAVAASGVITRCPRKVA